MIQLPFDFMLPESSWVPPTRLPDLSAFDELALDTENNDPELTSKGPACLRGLGHIAGISVAWKQEHEYCAIYLPIGHDTGNLDRNLVVMWLRDLCKRKRLWVLANGQYDLIWFMKQFGFIPEGTYFDIQIADCLIDEERPDGYSLESVGRRWLGKGKDERILREAANAFGFRPKEDIHRLHPRFVGSYAEMDAIRTLQLKHTLVPELEKEDQLGPMALEMEVMPILAQMTVRGIPVNQAFGQELNARWKLMETEALGRLRLSADDIWVPEVVARICQKAGVAPIKTEKGNDSYGKDHIAQSTDPVLKDLLLARAINRTRGTYLEQNLLINPYKGRIHPQYVQVASDEGGTRTYRFACKNPNAQQFPKRSRLFDAKSLRKCLVPEDGCIWAKLDYWSQEPVLQNHYAILEDLPGAHEVREAFGRGEKLYTFIEKATGGRCNYDQAKEVVLGRSYNMGPPKMAKRLGMDVEECAQILQEFDRVVPYIKQLSEKLANVARQRGYIRTLLGYRRRFLYWQPRKPKPWEAQGSEEFKFERPLRRNEAEAMWPGKDLERAWVYKAFNALIQGGAANQAKKAIVLAVREGILPTLLVHDEINSGSITSESQAKRLKEIMENAIPLRSPARADLDIGSSWQ